MARTFVQQSQISGSLAFNDTMAAGESLAGKQTLVGDLDALRSQINKIIGGERWYDALSGSQDLADIYAALHVDGSKANFQGAMDVVGVADFDSAVFMAASLGVSGTLDVAQAATLANGLTVNGAAADFNADVTANKISIDGDMAQRLYIVDSDGSIKDEEDLTYDGSKLGITGGLDVSAVADFGGDVFMDAALGVSGSLTVAGLADLNGALQVAGVADFAADVFMAASLGVSGSLTVDNGLTVSGDRLEVTGSMGITGAVDFDSTLNVDGVADFKADVYMAAALGVSGSASVAGALDAGSLEVAGLSDLNGALEVAGVADFASDVYMAAALGVSGSLTVAQDIGAVNVTLSGDLSAVSGSFSADLDVDGDLTAYKISIDGDIAQRLYIVDADGSIKDESKLTFDGSLLAIDGDLKVGGNDIKASDDSIAISLNGSNVAVKGNLTVEGNEIKSTTGTVMELSGLDAIFKANVQVDGDLRVKGSMTYIDTQNMRVEDAFIYLATGSAGTTDSGIVLHGGAGFDGVNTIDLVMGQDGGAGEFIFGKGNRAPDGDGAMDGIALVPAWMSEIKLGGLEGSLSGSFAATAAGAELSSSAALTVAAGASDALTLGAFNKEIDLMQAAEKDDFDTKFTATSVVGALVELFDMIGGGSAAKGDLSVANVSTNTLTFSSIGTLTAAEHKLVDVYLNGVLLSPSRDLSGLTTTTVDLDSNIASGLMADDVITVVIRSAA